MVYHTPFLMGVVLSPRSQSNYLLIKTKNNENHTSFIIKQKNVCRI